MRAAGRTAQHEDCMLFLKGEVDRRKEEAIMLVAGSRDDSRLAIGESFLLQCTAKDTSGAFGFRPFAFIVPHQQPTSQNRSWKSHLTPTHRLRDI